MKIYRKKNSFSEEEIDELSEIEKNLNLNRPALYRLSYPEIADAWSSLGQKLIKDSELIDSEGIFYLARWLRKENLNNFLEDALQISSQANGFQKLKAGGGMIAQPRGIVVQWVAGNTTTLPIFSLAQASLTKNSSIMRLSKNNIDLTLKILRLFEKIDSKAAKIILDNIVLAYFPHEERENHIKLSKIADCKAIWGSSESISFLKSLPEKDNCECVIFGPKYSIAVIDKESQNDSNFSEMINKLAMDIIVFDQMACSSPQTIFVEKGAKSLKEIAKILGNSLERLSIKYPKRIIMEDIAARIIRKRNEYLLDEKLDVLCSKENNWTILIGGDVKFEEAVQSRTVFLKEVNSLEEIQELINPKIQTVCMIVSTHRKGELAQKYFYKGAARCVSPGETNEYDWPWDGMKVLDRLVRWCKLS